MYLFDKIIWSHSIETHNQAKNRLFCPLFFLPNRLLSPIFSTDTNGVPFRVSLLEETECRLESCVVLSEARRPLLIRSPAGKADTKRRRQLMVWPKQDVKTSFTYSSVSNFLRFVYFFTQLLAALVFIRKDCSHATPHVSINKK